MNHKLKVFAGIFLAILITGCVSRPPQNLNNACDIFEEKRGWYKAALRTEKRWGTPAAVSLAIMHQESRFQARAKPKRTKLLWIIPWKRPSSAKGYAQALDNTWNAYRKETGNRFAKRSNFYDAMDFIGWYNDKTYKRNKVAKFDAFRLYLAYHEGQGGLEKGTHKNKKWLIDVARKVERRSKTYHSQLRACEDELRPSLLERLFFW